MREELIEDGRRLTPFEDAFNLSTARKILLSFLVALLIIRAAVEILCRTAREMLLKAFHG